jgi:peptide chain release factor 3
VMVIDAAKGIETQTRKLFEVCRLRNVPITTFINKMDREGRDPFELMDEIEQDLQLHVTPANWPIGSGKSFHGCYDLLKDQLLLFDRGKGDKLTPAISFHGLSDPALERHLPHGTVEKLREEAHLAASLSPQFELPVYREGHLTPVFFGSALNNFGVRELLEGLADYAPSPRPAPTTTRLVDPIEEKVSGFVFKIQANMDPKHRDRIAFFRVCSGKFERGMKLFHPRTEKTINVHTPVMFLAREREIAEEAYPGDIVGIPNHGQLRIGDALTEGEALRFTGIPSFAPELLQKVRATDPLKAKHLGKALTHLAEEGAAQVFRARLGGDWIVGVAGPLQFDVLADRIRTEYDLPVAFQPTSLFTARWLESDDDKELKRFVDEHEAAIGDDIHGLPVFLAANAYRMKVAEEDWPKIRFLKTREQVV